MCPEGTYNTVLLSAIRTKSEAPSREDRCSELSSHTPVFNAELSKMLIVKKKIKMKNIEKYDVFSP